MQGMPIGITKCRGNRGGNPAFSIVIVYEDFATGIKAQQACLNLFRGKTRDASCISVMWKFDLLRVAPLGEIAAADALKADVILFSLHGDRELPVEVKSWVASWLARKKNYPKAIAVMMDPASQNLESAQKTCAYLRETTEGGRIDFFSHSWVDSRHHSGLSPTTEAIRSHLHAWKQSFRIPRQSRSHSQVTVPNPGFACGQ
jgi:hypothetical protein